MKITQVNEDSLLVEDAEGNIKAECGLRKFISENNPQEGDGFVRDEAGGIYLEKEGNEPEEKPDSPVAEELETEPETEEDSPVEAEEPDDQEALTPEEDE